jgi:hypothetical protein
MTEGMHHFLIGSFLECFGDVFRAGGTRQPGEITVLDVGHGLAGERRFEVANGDGLVRVCHV